MRVLESPDDSALLIAHKGQKCFVLGRRLGWNQREV